MGVDIKALRGRIKSVDSTLHLTKAMELVASSKMRRATQSMTNGRAYVSAVENAIDLLAAAPECAKSPYMRQSGGERTCLIVIAGDRGLAGGYNANVFRLAATYKDARIIPIGRRACDRYGGQERSSERFSLSDAEKMARKLCKEFADEKFDKLGIVCTQYVSMLTQEARVLWVLPISRKDTAQRTGIIFEPDEAQILNSVVHEYVAGLLLGTVRESFACEVAARKSAMDSAGKNAQEMIDGLQLEYNRARQGAITQEITEIVAGSGTE